MFNNHNILNLVVNLDDYVPTLNNEDVDNLVEFCVELICAENSKEVYND